MFIIENWESIAGAAIAVWTGVVAGASALANIIPKKGLGRIVHFLAINFNVDKK